MSCKIRKLLAALLLLAMSVNSMPLLAEEAVYDGFTPEQISEIISEAEAGDALTMQDETSAEISLPEAVQEEASAKTSLPEAGSGEAALLPEAAEMPAASEEAPADLPEPTQEPPAAPEAENPDEEAEELPSPESDLPDAEAELTPAPEQEILPEGTEIPAEDSLEELPAPESEAAVIAEAMPVAAPRLDKGDDWTYEAEYDALCIPVEASAKHFTLKWSFEGEALEYRIQAAALPDEDEEPRFEEICVCTKKEAELSVSRFAGSIYILRIAAVLADGSQSVLQQNIRLLPAQLVLNADRLTLGVGEKFTLSDLSSAQLSFSSSASKYAAVSEDGVITAKRAGTATIFAEAADGRSAECAVTVKAAPKAVKLPAKKLTLAIGQSVSFAAAFTNDAAGLVSYSSSSNAVTVNESGLITAVHEGSAKISARAYNGKSASCTVTVIAAPTVLILSHSSISLPMGMTQAITPSVNAGSTAKYSYASSDESIAAVDQDGVIRAAAVGTAVITVSTHNGLTAECSVSVTPAPSIVSLNAAEITLGVGEKFQLAAETDLGEAEFSYASSSKYAVVSKDGLVSAKRKGSAVITVSAFNGVSAECSVTIMDAPKKISFPESALTLSIGQTAVLEATLPKGSAGAIAYTSSDESIVSADVSGRLTALSTGTAKITASAFNGKKAVCTVTVVPQPTALSLGVSELSLPVGMTHRLTPAVNEGSAAAFSYHSSDESIASVDAQGILTALNTGAAVITVATHNGLTAECNISVTPAPTSIRLNAGEITLGVKESFRLETSTDFSGDAGIRYTSSKTSVATVSEDGLITAKKAGTAIITASTFNGISSDCVVTVKKAPSSIKLDAKELLLSIGGTAKLNFTLSSGSAGSVCFTSADESIAAVDAEGTVTALAAGTVKISAMTYNGKKAECSVSVLAPGYSVSGLDNEGKTVRATVTTQEACVLRIEVWNDADSKRLHRSEADVAAGLSSEPLEIALKYSFPKNYILRAMLTDSKGNPLSTVCTNLRHTAAYQKFEDQSPEDFPPEKVLDFGDSGYGVLHDNVLRISADVTEKDDAYTFASAELPAPGSVLLLDGVPVKVAEAVSNGDGTVTVTQDKNVYLSDIYSVFKVDTAVDLGSASGARAKDKPESGEGGLDFFRETASLSFGPVSATADVGIGMNVTMSYDEKNLGKDYFEYECSVIADGSLTATLSAEYKNEDEDGNPPELLLYENDDIPIGTTGLFAVLKVSVPVEITAEVDGSGTLSFTAKTGFKYNPKDGSQKIEEKDGNAKFEIKGGFSIKSGPKIELGVSLGKILDVTASGWAGLQLVGTAEGLRYNPADATASEVHACDLCVDIEASFFADFEGKLSYEINKWLKDDLLTIELLSGDWVWDKAKSFYSVVNEKESIYGGEAKWDFGKCQNKKYRIDFQTFDIDKNEVNVPVTVSGKKMDTTTKTSPCFLQLYKGDYSAAAQFESGVGRRGFSVENSAKGIILEEEPIYISGTITDEETGKSISGALVTATLPDGSVRRTTTNKAGFFEFDPLPGGKYSLSFSAKNYENESFENVTYSPGMHVQVNESLKPIQMLPLIGVEKLGNNSKAKAKALTESSMKIPEITMTTSGSSKYIDRIEVSCPEWSFPMVYERDRLEFLTTAYLYGMDMGNGDYTYVLYTHGNSFYYGDHGSVIVFHVPSLGIPQTIKEFLDRYKEHPGGLHMDGTFRNRNDFTATLYPSGRELTGWIPNGMEGKIYQQSGCTFSYEEREDGCYDLIIGIVMDFGDVGYVGKFNTRYTMVDGAFSMAEQWLKVGESSSVTYK